MIPPLDARVTSTPDPLPPTLNPSPILTLLFTPIPPPTTSAPEEVSADSVSVVKPTSPSTFNFLSISTPPETTSAALRPENSVSSKILTGLLLVTRLLPTVVNTKLPVDAEISFPSIITLSTVNFAAVAAIPTFKVSVSV